MENQPHPNAEVMAEVLKANPNVQFKTDRKIAWFYYYMPSVKKSNIVVNKIKRDIYSSTTAKCILAHKYMTDKEAREAITHSIPKAIEKFKECLKAKQELQAKLGFESGFYYEGDSYGIEDEYDCISFDMDGFHFQFNESDAKNL